MSAAVTLSLAQQPEHTLVADCIAADRFASLGAKQIAELPVVHGGRRATLGDFFKVRGGRSTTLRIEGDLARVEGIGTAMAGGEIVIAGGAGRDVGAYRPPPLPVLLRYLRARYGLAVAEPHITGRYARYSGDLAELGRGEILQWVAP